MLSIVLFTAAILALSLLITYGCVWVLRSIGVDYDNGETIDPLDPIERLRDRYAAGDLSDDEFDHRLDRLLASESLSEELEPSMER